MRPCYMLRATFPAHAILFFIIILILMGEKL
jgi:hypothetical protein